jgi:hypothetical protein
MSCELSLRLALAAIMSGSATSSFFEVFFLFIVGSLTRL